MVLLVTLSVAGFCVWKAERVQAVQTATVPISQIRLGDCVPGENPEGDVEDAPVLAELWRAVSIEATLQDGSRLELDLLRPESWVRAHGLTVGADVPVEFGETHTQSGTGKVKRINPCPPLRAGPGKIVTGLFRHATPEIFTVSTADGERLNATAEHPFWSQDRQAFVPAKELQPGERLRHLTGETSVVSVHSRPARETVYNLEVHGSHVFHVGQAGLLVHNCGNAVRSRIKESSKLAREAESAGRSAQDSIDKLTSQLARGNLDPGIGTRPIGRGISEARARDGARVYFRQLSDGSIEILGKSTKANQAKVIHEVLDLFGQ